MDSKNYNINDFFIENADIKDINSIMFIEKTSFAKEITEDKKVFIERLETFPEGFFILRERQSNEAAGYITCEIWNRKQFQKNTGEKAWEASFLIWHWTKFPLIFPKSIIISSWLIPFGKMLYPFTKGKALKKATLPLTQNRGFLKIFLNRMVSKVRE